MNSIQPITPMSIGDKGVLAGMKPPESLRHLHEAIVEIAAIAKTVDYRPHDSWDFHANVIRWSHEWEGVFADGVAGGRWEEDEWLERTEAFALSKLCDVSHLCVRWTVRDDGVAVLPSMDAILPAGAVVNEGDTFIVDAAGNKLTSFGPRVLDRKGGTSCVIPAIGVPMQFWGVYEHDAKGYASCIGDAVDRHSAMAFAEAISKRCAIAPKAD